MAKSKTSPRHKEYTKKKTQQKQLIKHKIKQMEQNLNQGPISFVYSKDKQTVEVPLQEWQALNAAADRLQDIAMFVTTMRLINQQHMQNGTLLPVFSTDIEKDPEGGTNPDGSPKMILKESFWTKGGGLGKPTIVKADGETIYEASEVEKEKSNIIIP